MHGAENAVGADNVGSAELASTTRVGRVVHRSWSGRFERRGGRERESADEEVIGGWRGWRC